LKSKGRRSAKRVLGSNCAWANFTEKYPKDEGAQVLLILRGSVLNLLDRGGVKQIIQQIGILGSIQGLIRLATWNSGRLIMLEFGSV
jgi:hypothetical protein